LPRTRSLLVCILTSSCLLGVVASAQACTKTWVGGSGGWGEENHWSPKGVPGSSDAVCITAPATVTVPANGGVAKTLTAGGGSGEVTIDVVGESYDNAGNTSNETDLGIVETASFAANTKLILESTNATTEAKVQPHGAGAGLVGGSVVEAGRIEAVNKGAPWANRIKLAGLRIDPGASLLNASGTLLFLKEGEGGYPWSVTNEGTFTVATGASARMEPSFSGKAGFINDAAVVNDGSIVGSGAEWTQRAGSVSGNPVELQSPEGRSASLDDADGAGAFLFNYGTVTLTGTIPSSQTVTVRGEPFDYQGETYYTTGLSNGGKELVNDGTLVLNPTGTGETGGNVNIEPGSIHNNGVIDVETETASRVTQLQESLTNGPSGRLEIDGGIFQGNSGAPLTNEGLVTVAPGAVYQLQEGSTFLNEPGGTFSPEIANASSVGAVQLTGPCCNGPGTFTAGGTLAPVLLGGFVPSIGEEFDLFELDGGKFEGTFPAVANDFFADYSQEASETAFVGVTYGAARVGSGGSTGTGSSTGTGGSTGGSGSGASSAPAPLVHVVSAAGGQGSLVVTLSCPAGAGACQAASLQATVTEHLKGAKVTAISAKKKKPAAKTKQVVIASGGATLAAGASQTLTLTLNGAGSALLAKYGKLTTLVAVSSAGKTIGTATIALHKAKATKGKKK
jgi:hypothetical protein